VRYLLDVGVLIALCDSMHPANSKVSQWIAKEKPQVATCPIVLNGAIRILTNPSYGRGPETLRAAAPNNLSILQAIGFVQILLASLNHEFWADELALTDEKTFVRNRIYGPRQLTDIFLLATAVSKKGCLITLDQGIPLSPVVGAKAENLKIL
jgi:predicted nucleic acid-binding protein